MLPISSSLIFVNKNSLTEIPWSFSKKMAQLCLWTKIRSKKWLIFGASSFQCKPAEYLWPKWDNFVCLHTHQDQNELHLTRRFFVKIGIFFKSDAGSISHRKDTFPLWCWGSSAASSSHIKETAFLFMFFGHLWAVGLLSLPSKICVTWTSQRQLTLYRTIFVKPFVKYSWRQSIMCLKIKPIL